VGGALKQTYMFTSGYIYMAGRNLSFMNDKFWNKRKHTEELILYDYYCVCVVWTTRIFLFSGNKKIILGWIILALVEKWARERESGRERKYTER
jgi:hypothetical protein